MRCDKLRDMETTGLKGSLDDAFTLAAKVKVELGFAFYNEDAGPQTRETLADLFDLADDLTSRISNLILQLRS